MSMTKAYAARRPERKPAAWRCIDHDGETRFTGGADVADYWRQIGLAVTELFE